MCVRARSAERTARGCTHPTGRPHPDEDQAGGRLSTSQCPENIESLKILKVFNYYRFLARSRHSPCNPDQGPEARRAPPRRASCWQASMGGHPRGSDDFGASVSTTPPLQLAGPQSVAALCFSTSQSYAGACCSPPSGDGSAACREGLRLGRDLDGRAGRRLRGWLRARGGSDWVRLVPWVFTSPSRWDFPGRS